MRYFWAKVARDPDLWHAGGMESSEQPGYRQRHERELEDKLSKAAEDNLNEQKLFSESPVDYAKRRLDELLSDAIDELYNLVKFEDDPKIRFTVVKYVIDRAFGSTSPATGRYTEKEEDPLFSFIEKIANKVSKD